FIIPGCSLAPEESGHRHSTPSEVLPTASLASPGLSDEQMVQLAQDDPVSFLEQVIERYDRRVRGYRARLLKQERIEGKLQPVEHIDVLFREKPFSVRLEWQEGARLAQKILYVDGANQNHMVVQPAGWRSLAGLVHRLPGDSDARTSSRYPINEFGIRMGSQRTLMAWKEASDRGSPVFEYGGIESIPELDGLVCLIIQRREDAGLDAEGIAVSRFYFDTRDWLQVGSVLQDQHGETIGRYYFLDLEINPTFEGKIFSPVGLKDRRKK
ncbi:MAG: DUF1571 domain-containing protein, partial [Gemmataceae bacterium]